MRAIIPVLTALPVAPGTQSAGSVAGRITYAGTVPEPVYVFESGTSQPVIAVDGRKGMMAWIYVFDHRASRPPRERATSSCATCPPAAIACRCDTVHPDYHGTRR